MRTACRAAGGMCSIQFTLIGLMELVTIWAIVFALCGMTGVAASCFLAMMAVALAARCGPFALIMLAAALIAADWPVDALHGDRSLRPLLVILVSTLLCMWYRRGFWQSRNEEVILEPTPSDGDRQHHELV